MLGADNTSCVICLKPRPRPFFLIPRVTHKHMAYPVALPATLTQQIGNGHIRYIPDPMRASIIDVIKLATGQNNNISAKSYHRLCEDYPEILTCVRSGHSGHVRPCQAISGHGTSGLSGLSGLPIRPVRPTYQAVSGLSGLSGHGPSGVVVRPI